MRMPNIINILGAPTQQSVLDEIAKEVTSARQKFPNNSHMLVALMEEVGELAQALLEEGNSAHARAEAVQVAAMAVRIIEEGDGDFAQSQQEPSKASSNPTSSDDDLLLDVKMLVMSKKITSFDLLKQNLRLDERLGETDVKILSHIIWNIVTDGTSASYYVLPDNHEFRSIVDNLVELGYLSLLELERDHRPYEVAFMTNRCRVFLT